MPTIESYLQNSSIPQQAKADAWEAYQTPDHDNFVSSVGKLNVPQNVKADMYEMRFGGNKAQAAPAAPSAPPSMIDNLENMAGRATSYIKNLASKPIPTVSPEDLAQHPTTAKAFQAVSDFAGKPLIPDSVRNYVSDVSAHASTIPGHPLASAVLKGVDQGSGKMAAGLTTPANLGTMAALAIPGVGEAAALGFGLQGTAQAVREGAAAKDSYDQGNLQDTAEHATTSVLNAGMSFLGLRGMLHDGTPPTNPSSPEVPVADHPMDREASVASPQTQPSPEFNTTVPSTTPPNAAGAFDLLGRPTDADSYKLGTKGDQGVRVKPLAGLLPAPALEATGEALPPKTAEAPVMSPEAEAVSKVAQDKAEGQPEAPIQQPETKPVSPQAPSVSTPTEGPRAQVNPQLSDIEDKIRTQTGKIMGLQELLQGNKIHAALERATDETLDAKNPRSRSVGPGITPDDQGLLSIAMGEPVGKVLTDDQLDKAYALRGKVLGDTPTIQNRPDASKATLAASREAMERDLANTTDPEAKAKLKSALEPDEDGEPKTMVYKAQRKNAPPVDIDPDHPQAAFRSKTFGAPYPEISLENLKAALPGENIRTKDMNMGDPELKALRQQKLAQAVTAAGKGTVSENTDAFNYDSPNNPKGIMGEAKLADHAYFEGAVQNKITQISSQLRDNVKAHQALYDPSQPSKLIEDLNKLPAQSLPKEVQDLVKPAKPKTGETPASSPASTRAKAPEARNVTPSSPTTTLGKAKAGIASLYDHFQKNAPANLKDARTIVQTAADHFGNDTNGAVVATFHGLKVLKQGIDEGNDWAMRDAIKAIKRLKPRDDNGSAENLFNQSGASYVNTKGGREGNTFYTGLDPEIGKGIAKDVKSAVSKAAAYVKPELTDEDRVVSSEFAANSYLSRYEKMAPTNRSAYSKDIWSDETDRKIREGDPDNSKGYQDRLDELRKSVPKADLNALFKSFFADETPNQKLARDTQANVRAKNGTRARLDTMLENKLTDASAKADQWSSFESRDFAHKMELGLEQDTPEKNSLAQMLRTALDQARERITAANGNFEEYLQNYFPHIWANVGRGQELYHQTAGMSGDQSFTKSRELDTINQGIANGLSLVTENPIKLTLMRVEQMNRYAMKETLAKEMKASGAAQFIESGKPVPRGFDPLNDRAFQQQIQGGRPGQYIAPKEVAKMFNRFTSTGLSGKAGSIAGLPVYDMFRTANNVQNAAELSWSGLHGFFGVTNSILSEQARGGMQITNALFKGDAEGVKAGLKTLANSPNFIGKIKLGRNLVAHLRDPDKFQEMSSIADAFERSGGRIGQDKFLGTSFGQKAVDSWKRAADDSLSAVDRGKAGVGVLFNNIGRAMEFTSKPIMEKLIPYLKAGHFATEAGEILRNADGKKWSDVTQELQRVSDNMDDRFGQLVYDNLFMDRAAKDILAVTMRSPGWNIGTARAGIGGLTDIAKGIRDASTKQQKFQITSRTAYLGALVANTMLINGALNVMLSGTMPHGIDYFFARTGSNDANGEPNRIMPKLYTYDYINFANHPVETVLHKASPLIGTAIDLYHNKSFYGREIYDPGSSAGAKLADAAKYLGGQYLPFSATNFLEASRRGDSLLKSAVQSATGILPAPKWAGRSAAEDQAAEYHANSMAQGGEPGDVFDRYAKFSKVQADIRSGKIDSAELTKRVQSGEIPIGLIDHVFDKTQTPNLERWTKALKSPQEAMNVFDKATPEEKQRLMPIMLEKLDKLDPSEMPAFAEKLQANQFHPDTHVFSQSRWKEANPGEDHHAAASQAKAQGYEVHP